ncbi:MAG: acetylxylan esterase, partial [Alistipes sp.]|nr:acetylxylan esterase [Alistipes sp.]
MKRLALFIVLSLSIFVVEAQPKISFIKVEVTPDHADWLYKCGEKPQFAISVRTCSNAPVKDAEIYYEVSEDMLPPIAKGNMVLKDGTTTIKGYTMRKPGFLRCRVWATVDGVKYDECATAGFDIGQITPKTVMPADFKEFWAESLRRNEKLEMLPQMTLVP